MPDHVLDELLEAFSEESAPQYDFDDPSIDRILGITDEHAEPDHESDGDDEADDDDPDDDEPDDDEPDDDEPDDDEPVDDVRVPRPRRVDSPHVVVRVAPTEITPVVENDRRPLSLPMTIVRTPSTSMTTRAARGQGRLRWAVDDRHRRPRRTRSQ